MAAFPGRQVVLFLVAVLFPAAALAGLGLRVIGQERELAEKRLSDERHRVPATVHTSLLAELETIKSAAAGPLAGTGHLPHRRTYGHPAVDLIALIEDGQLVLPWERDDQVAQARASLRQLRSRAPLRAASESELADGRVGVAIEACRRSVRDAEDQVHAAYGRLLLARAFRKVGREPEAVPLPTEVGIRPWSDTRPTISSLAGHRAGVAWSSAATVPVSTVCGRYP